MTLILCFMLKTSGRASEALRCLALVTGVFVILGGGYFLWRFHYFGYLLPNPFYKKGGGHLYPDSLHRSTYNMFKMLLPLLPLAFIGFYIRETRRRTIFVFATPFFFSLIWVLLSNENNWYMRFQYVAIPLTLMSIPYITEHLEHLFSNAFQFNLEKQFGRWSVLAFAAVMTVMLGGTYWKVLYNLPVRNNGSGAYDIALGLHQWKNRQYTMVLTEAGVIPYFSDWRVIDAWGLNDSHIEHDTRGLTAEYLDANHPAIIMFHLANRNGIDDYQSVWRGDAPLHQDPSAFMSVLANYATYPQL
jgi:arabinofuranosyltransferase